jgi:hypothetical protein
MPREHRTHNFFPIGVGIVKVMEWGSDLSGTD